MPSGANREKSKHTTQVATSKIPPRIWRQYTERNCRCHIFRRPVVYCQQLSSDRRETVLNRRLCNSQQTRDTRNRAATVETEPRPSKQSRDRHSPLASKGAVRRCPISPDRLIST